MYNKYFILAELSGRIMLDKKIGILANSNDLKKTIENIYHEDIKKGRILIDVLNPDRINEQGRALERRGARAIIARSGGYRHTLGKVNVPVINMKIYIQDILHAIMVAEKYNKNVVLVLSDMDDFDYEEWKGLIHSRLIIEKFYRVEEIEGVVGKYKSKRDEAVIVGGGIPCSYAESYNLDYVNLNVSDETVRDVVSRAWEIVDNLYEQKYKNNILNNILDHVHDAVIAVDRNENVIMFNERAEKLLARDKGNVLGSKLKEVFPDLGFVADVLKSNRNISNVIVNLKNIVVTVNVTLLEMEGQIEGALCTFQDITKLQNFEKRIRYELNKKGLTAKYKFNDLIAFDPAMKSTIVRAMQIGGSDSTAMLYGESGAGKEMIAQSIHNMSKRCKEPFVAVNCAALTESLLESELFGYEEGAFTGARKGGKPGLFELAHGGTIFLDEINSISLNLQTKLLRVLEEKEVMRIGSDYVVPLDVRILAAANESLKEKIHNSSFRNDLFYRLNILELHIPPLRKRKMDILPLFEHFVSLYSKDGRKPVLDDRIKGMLLDCPWPGNVRELRNAAERYVLFGELDIGVDMPETENDGENRPVAKNDNMGNIKLDLKEIDRYVEQKVISMLESQGMSKNEIARVLGISRSSLWSKTNSKMSEK